MKLQHILLINFCVLFIAKKLSNLLKNSFSFHLTTAQSEVGQLRLYEYTNYIKLFILLYDYKYFNVSKKWEEIIVEVLRV